MSLRLYGHPFASCVQKVLIAVYEGASSSSFWWLTAANRVTSEFAPVAPFENSVLDSGEQIVFEATSIIEWLD